MAKKKAAPNLDHIEPQLRPLAIPVSELVHDEKQANQHNERSIAEIKKSLERHGQKKSIVVRREGMMVKAGNGTLMAARELGWTHIAAVVSDDTDELLREYAIRDNRTTQFAVFDPDIVIQEIEELEIEPVDIGWDEEEFSFMVAESKENRRNSGGGGTYNQCDEKDLRTTFQVIVDCDDEAMQDGLITELIGRGFKCQALII